MTTPKLPAPATSPESNGPAPSWQDFCARLAKNAPSLKPDEQDQQWQNLYGIYQMGFEACLEKMKVLLQDEQNAALCRVAEQPKAKDL